MLNSFIKVQKKFPFVIELAILRLQTEGLPQQFLDFVYNFSGRQQAMDPRRKSSIIRLLCVILRCYDLATRQIVRIVQNNLAVPVTEEWLAEQADMSVKTVRRVFNYLRAMGLILWKKQRVRHVNMPEGIRYVFFAITRVVSDKLFELLKLTRALIKCRSGRLAKLFMVNIVKGKQTNKKPKIVTPHLKIAPEILYAESVFLSNHKYFDALRAKGFPKELIRQMAERIARNRQVFYEKQASKTKNLTHQPCQLSL